LSVCFCSNYQQIQHLGYAGHEIATESISQQLGLQDKGYEEWVGEMIGMREILRHFANVSVNDVVGMRAPFLKPGRNTQYKVSSLIPLYTPPFFCSSSLLAHFIHKHTQLHIVERLDRRAADKWGVASQGTGTDTDTDTAAQIKCTFHSHSHSYSHCHSHNTHAHTSEHIIDWQLSTVPFLAIDQETI